MDGTVTDLTRDAARAGRRMAYRGLGRPAGGGACGLGLRRSTGRRRHRVPPAGDAGRARRAARRGRGEWVRREAAGPHRRVRPVRPGADAADAVRVAGGGGGAGDRRPRGRLRPGDGGRRRHDPHGRQPRRRTSRAGPRVGYGWGGLPVRDRSVRVDRARPCCGSRRRARDPASVRLPAFGSAGGRGGIVAAHVRRGPRQGGRDHLPGGGRGRRADPATSAPSSTTCSGRPWCSSSSTPTAGSCVRTASTRSAGAPASGSGRRHVWELRTTRLTPAMARPWALGGSATRSCTVMPTWGSSSPRVEAPAPRPARHPGGCRVRACRTSWLLAALPGGQAGPVALRVRYGRRSCRRRLTQASRLAMPASIGLARIVRSDRPPTGRSSVSAGPGA